MKFTSEQMKRAWALARAVSENIRPRDFLGWAIREVRKMNDIKEIREIKTVLGGKRGTKAYVARIVALGGHYGLERDFLRGEYDHDAGHLIVTTDKLSDGVYEVQGGDKSRTYLAVSEGAIYKLASREEAEKVFTNGLTHDKPVGRIAAAPEPKETSEVANIKTEMKRIESRGVWWNGNLEDLANARDAERYFALESKLANLQASK